MGTSFAFLAAVVLGLAIIEVAVHVFAFVLYVPTRLVDSYGNPSWIRYDTSVLKAVFVWEIVSRIFLIAKHDGIFWLFFPMWLWYRSPNSLTGRQTYLLWCRMFLYWLYVISVCFVVWLIFQSLSHI